MMHFHIESKIVYNTDVILDIEIDRYYYLYDYYHIDILNRVFHYKIVHSFLLPKNLLVVWYNFFLVSEF